MVAVNTKPAGAGAKVRRHRYYAYEGKDGKQVWFTHAIHAMLLEHPSWISRFHVDRATGESRLMVLEEYRALRRNGLKASP